MSQSSDKLNDALNIDIDSIISEAESQLGATNGDDKLIEKYQQRRSCIEEAKQNLKDARLMSNRNWAEALLKKSAENIMISQEIFVKEIEDDPASKNLTAMGELSNSLVNTVKSVQELDDNAIKLKQSQEKIDLRRKEIEMNSGEIINAEGKNIIGVGTGQDILRLIKNGIDPTSIEVENEE